MSETQAELKARISHCKQRARTMFESATGALTEELRSECLMLATEWLHLATHIERLLTEPLSSPP